MYRVENKYVIPPQDYFELSKRLGAVLQRDNNTVDGSKEYKVSSLYFDDIIDTDYYDTLSGNPFRKKHRIRIYNDLFSDIKLEVKTKQYNRISKRTHLITEEEMRSLMAGDIITWGNNRDDPRTVFNEKILSKGLRPRVIVTYEREAFLYDAGNVRITFDRNIRASNVPDKFGNTNLDYDFLDGDYVLEVKYDAFIPNFILQLLEIDSMVPATYSKYQRCREIYL